MFKCFKINSEKKMCDIYFVYRENIPKPYAQKWDYPMLQKAPTSESQRWLSILTLTLHFPALEKAMAIRSSVLAWTIPESGEPGGMLSMGSHRVGHEWSDLAAASALHPNGPGGGTGRKVLLGGGRDGGRAEEGTPIAGHRDAAPHPGPGGNGGQWCHLSSVQGSQGTRNDFQHLLSCSSIYCRGQRHHTKGLLVQAEGSPGEYNTAQKRAW